MNVGMQDVAAGSLDLLTIAQVAMSLERQCMCRIEPETQICRGRKMAQKHRVGPKPWFSA
jgi:hypothetical protein